MTTHKYETWMLRTCREKEEGGREKEVKALADV